MEYSMRVSPTEWIFYSPQVSNYLQTKNNATLLQIGFEFKDKTIE